MRSINRKALSILNKDEKAALALHNIHNKSTWQAGEILKKSHYKYLEIKQRAQRFFEMFSVHYEAYGQLVPEELEDKLDPLFSAHIKNLVELRLTPNGSAQMIDHPKFYIKEFRDALVVESMRKLAYSPYASSQNLYSVIMEFDRYNNFRVLPQEIQEPSAFKRRNKTRYRRHLEISTTIHPYTLHRIKELFEVGNRATKDIAYIALINMEHGISDVVKIQKNPQTYNTLTNCSLYIFDKDEEAIEYAELTAGYLEPTYRDPKQGLEFWPKFRILIKRAVNYYDINNITPTRKHLMSAVRDMDMYYLNRQKETKAKGYYKSLKR